jgi:hypothetical protein
MRATGIEEDKKMAVGIRKGFESLEINFSSSSQFLRMPTVLFLFFITSLFFDRAWNYAQHLLKLPCVSVFMHEII